MSVESDRKELAGTEGKGYTGPAELLWSPDSSAFAVTWSDGGAVGTWNVDVYLIMGHRASYVALTNSLKKDFMPRYKCQVPEDPNANEEPNVGAAAWVEGSKKLLLIAEVAPHSSCAQMGIFMGYLVSVPSGSILKRYTRKQLLKSWRMALGERHRAD